MSEIIGRKQEKRLLKQVYSSKKGQFLALYGRRRVGKTYLVNQFFREQDCYFINVTGQYKGKMKDQLANFNAEIANVFYNDANLADLRSWDEAFSVINKLLAQTDQDKKFVLFLDELPWLATVRSSLLSKLEYFWNRYWSNDPRMILIVCGSSASWIIRNIINCRGGLHNRTTHTIEISPFSLHEVEAFLKSRSCRLNRRETLKLYMAIGGIPYYLEMVDGSLSAAQNIEELFFIQKAKLKDEFNKMFKSLFKSYQFYIDLIILISQYPEGIERSVIEAKLSLEGGRLTQRLDDLALAGFIQKFIPWGKEKGEYYKLVDEFCLFYLHWVFNTKATKFSKEHWVAQSQTPAYHAWSGLAFESICHKHYLQISSALRIPKGSLVSSWRYRSKDNKQSGAQVDMLFDRPDAAITLGEIKYTDELFVIHKEYAQKLLNREKIFQSVTKTNKQIFHALISMSGLKDNSYSDIISRVCSLGDLFKDES